MEQKRLKQNDEDRKAEIGLLCQNCRAKDVEIERWRQDKVIRETAPRRGSLGAWKWEGTERLRRSRITAAVRRQKQRNRNKVVNKGRQSEKSSVAALDMRRKINGMA